MLKNVDWTRWGPLTVGIVGVSLLVTIFTGAYLIIVEPTTDQIIGFLKALGEFAGSSAALAIAHAIWRHGQDQQEAAITARTALPGYQEEFGEVPKPEGALRPVAPPGEPTGGP